jgi:hypothetical protein
MSIAIVGTTGAVLEVLMAGPEDRPVLVERYPGMQIIDVPADLYPGQGWTYRDGRFVEPPGAQQRQQIEF